MGFAKFMASGAGRALRAVAGIALIVVGAVLGGGWWALSAVGLVFVAVGVFDVCLLAPLFGQPLSGKEVRGR
jgi:nicotinamide mononucleotide (NMN) deamidase PncC